VFTRLGDEFDAWVKVRCLKRNEQLAVEKDLNISLDTHIAAAFHKSTAVSCKSYGVCFLLLILTLSYCFCI
jgi:hypothetical protein